MDRWHVSELRTHRLTEVYLSF